MTPEDLTWLSTRELAEAIGTGQISSREATEAHLRRIEEINPVLNAVVTLDADGAMERAAIADKRFASGARVGRLHGVPMTHKDTHDTIGMRTTWGSPVWADRVPDSDALIVSRLRDAGVNTTGKTNVPEFAAGAHTFNRVFGTTLNPYDPSKSAAGSSGGVGVALATGVQASGDGSDMGGSLRLPASFNNVVGLRPSNGWIPHTPPGNPFTWLAQSGFMARTVSDVALLMEVAAGPAVDGPLSIQRPGSVFGLPEFSAREYHPSLAGVRVGFAPDMAGRIVVDDEVRAVVAATAEVFTSLDAELTEDCIDLDSAAEVFDVGRAFDFAYNFADIVRQNPGMVKESVVTNTESGLELSVDNLLSAAAARAKLSAAVSEFFRDHDVLVTTTSQVLPFAADLEYPTEINEVAMPHYLDWMRSATLVSATGCPAISVPAGFSASGLPIGVQLVAAPGKDVELLRYAYAFEAATRVADRHPNL